MSAEVTQHRSASVRALAAAARVAGCIAGSVDLLVYTPEESERGMKQRLGVFDAIAREGVLLYAHSGG